MKGAFYTIEVIISVLLVMSVFFILFTSPINNPEIERANVKSQMYNGLENLNTIGLLRSYALNNNASGIETELSPYTPLGIQLQVTIYNKSFSNLTEELSDQPLDIVGVSYYIAGEFGNYTPREVRVHAWGFT